MGIGIRVTRQAASGPASACVRGKEGMASKAAAPTTRAAALNHPLVLRRLPRLPRGPTWLRCELVRIGARLGFRAPAKVRLRYSGVARRPGICSAVIGSAAQRGHVPAAAEHTRVLCVLATGYYEYSHL